MPRSSLSYKGEIDVPPLSHQKKADVIACKAAVFPLLLELCAEVPLLRSSPFFALQPKVLRRDEGRALQYFDTHRKGSRQGPPLPSPSDKGSFAEKVQESGPGPPWQKRVPFFPSLPWTAYSYFMTYEGPAEKYEVGVAFPTSPLVLCWD